MDETIPEEKTLWERPIVQTLLLAAGIGIAVILGYSDAVAGLASYGLAGRVIAVFLAGFMYASLFTVAPATVGIIQLAGAGVPAWFIGCVGGLGAMTGDLALFRIIKVGLIDVVLTKIRQQPGRVLSMLFQIRLFRIFLMVVGVVVIATPLPDELGLAIMGLSKARWPVIALIGLLFNGMGMAVIATLAR